MRRPRKQLPLKPFAEVLKFVMEMRGYASASDLAEDTGISGPTLSRYMSGQRPRPSAAEIVALARVLRFDAEDLLGASAKMIEETPSEPEPETTGPSLPGKLRKKAEVEATPAPSEKALRAPRRADE